MKKLFVLLTAFVGVCAAFAAEYVFLPGATDFSLTSSYQGSPATLPGSGDDIVLPENQTIAIDSSTASFATFANCRRVIPQAGSVVEITVTEGRADMPAAFSSYGREGGGYKIGEIVKKGDGELWLGADAVVANDTSYYDYYAALTVKAGILRMPQYCTAALVYYGRVTVDAGAVLYITASKQSSGSWSQFRQLLGDGELRNAPKTSPESTRTGNSFALCGSSGTEDSYFTGKILSPITFYNNSGGNLTLTGTNNTMNSVYFSSGDATYPASTARNVLRVSSIKGSLGCNRIMFVNTCGALCYIGNDAETADVPMTFQATSSGYDARHPIIDAGAYGGLDLTGVWTAEIGRDFVRTVELTGSNTVECVLDNEMVNGSASSNVIYVTKRGTGIWRFGNGNRKNRDALGGIAVEDGTLRFDSIAERGEISSLGRAEVLTAGDPAALHDGALVDYAYLLGGEGTDPVFEYTGSFDAFCATRPIALAYGGGHLRNSTDVGFEFSGVSARDANSSPTLVLDGTGTSDGNVVREISDGASGAKVSVTKEGTGSWQLGGNLTFSGKLKVSGGSLALEKQNRSPSAATYKWFRLSFAHMSNGSGELSLRQIGLYDADGVRQNVGLVALCGDSLKEKNEVYVAPTVPAGHVAWDKSMAGRYVKVTSENGLSDSFREDGYNGITATGVSLYQSQSATTANMFDVTDPTTWVRIVMHLSDEAKPIHHFDIQAMGNHKNYFADRLMLEGSLDGVDWDVVWSNVKTGDALDHSSVAGYNLWYSDHTEGSNANHARPSGKGFNLTASSGVPHNQFTWFRLSIAQIGTAADKFAELQIREICLFDEDGNRQNVKLNVRTNGEVKAGVQEVYVPNEVEPGEAAFDRSVSGRWMQLIRTSGNEVGLAECFVNTFRSGFDAEKNSHSLHIVWMSDETNQLIPTPDDRETWIPIVMRLKEGASQITHFDVQLFSNSNSKNNWPSRLLLEGSRDGRHWTTVFNNATQGEAFDLGKCGGSTYGLQDANKWLSDGKAAFDPSEPDNYCKRIYGEGLTLTQTGVAYDDAVYSQLANVSSVQAENGGVLSTPESRTIKGLTVDVTKSAGTIRGFAFDSTGTIDVLGDWSADALPVVFEDCTGVENLANWTVYANGKLKSGRKIVVKDGKLFVMKSGIVLLVR